MRQYLLVGLVLSASAIASPDCASLYKDAAHVVVDTKSLTAHGYSLRAFNPAISREILASYNHTTEGCGSPADNVISAYSRYGKGMVFYRCGDLVVSRHPLDRVLLADALDGKITIQSSAPHVDQCGPRSDYLPIYPHYKMPGE